MPAQRAAPPAVRPVPPFIPVPPTAPPAGLDGPPGPHGWLPPPRRRGLAALALVGGVATVLASLAGAGALLAVLASPSVAPAGPAPSTGSAQVEAIGAWYRGGGRRILGELAQDFEDAGSATDTDTLRAACTGLRGHVEAAQAYAPIPDAEAHRHFTAALGRYAVGASDCLAGIRGRSPELIGRAGDELAAGTRSLTESTQRIATLAGG